jgi:hypothetical protein
MLAAVAVEQHLAVLLGFLSLAALAVLDAGLCSTYSLMRVAAAAAEEPVVLLAVVVAVVVVPSGQIEMHPLPWRGQSI